jgi:autotransporter-associated beta strand protein
VTFASPLTSVGGSLTVYGVGTLTLTGVNAYTGGTTLSAGTLVAANNAAFGAVNSPVAITGGILSVGGFALADDFSGTGGTILTTGNATLGSSTNLAGFNYDGTLNVGGNAVALQSGSGTSTISNVLLGFGSLTSVHGIALNYGGSLTATGSATVNGLFYNLGTGGASATVIGPTGGNFLTFTGPFAGNGSIGGNVRFLNTVTPGNNSGVADGTTIINPPGVTDFSKATLIIGISGDTTPGTDYDNYSVLNGATVSLGSGISPTSSSTLQLTTKNGFVVTAGDSFNLFVFSGTGTVSGTFTNFDFSQASLSSPLLASWDTSQLYTTGVITVDSLNNYYTGAGSGIWTDPTNFATTDSVTGPAQTHALFASSNVFLGATGATNTVSQLAPTGNVSSFAINSLIFKGAAGAVLNGGTNNPSNPSTLTINAANAFLDQNNVTHSAGIGLLVEAGTGPVTIGQDVQIVMGNSQTWEIDSSPSNPVTFNGYLIDNFVNSNGGPALSLTKTGPGVLILGDVGQQDGYGGGTAVLGGTLQLGVNAYLGESTGVGSLTVSGGTIDLNGTPQLVASISLSTGGAIVDSQGTGTAASLIVNGGVVVTGSGTTTLAASLYDGTDSNSTAIDTTLTKTGTGTLNVLAAQFYTGLTQISAGVVNLATSGSIAGDVNVTGGTLGGTGSVGGTVTVSSGGQLYAGPVGGGGAGRLSLGSATLQSGSSLAFNLSSTGGLAAAAGTSFSQLALGGPLNFSGVGAGSITVNLAPVVGNLIDNGHEFYTWASVVTSTGIVGSFAASDFTFNSSAFAPGGTLGSFSFSIAADGTNLDLTYVSNIPETSTMALLTGLSVLGLAALRRRRAARR